MACTDASGTSTYHLSEPAPVNPEAPYEENQQLAPGAYCLLPRPTEGGVLPKGSPVYTTPGEQAGTIITPTGKKRGGLEYPVGPHVAGPQRRSKGCPLFPNTKAGRKQQEEFYRRFRENIKTGGTWVYILDPPLRLEGMF
jgi:hypothetical protein